MNCLALNWLLAATPLTPLIVGIVSAVLLIVASVVAVISLIRHIRRRRSEGLFRFRPVAILIAGALLVAVVGLVWFSTKRSQAAAEDREIAEVQQALQRIEQLGGKVRFRDDLAVEVDLGGTETTDSGLEEVSRLSQLESLDLESIRKCHAAFSGVCSVVVWYRKSGRSTGAHWRSMIPM